jgi:predicted RNase H-like HicB family nuclease
MIPNGVLVTNMAKGGGWRNDAPSQRRDRTGRAWLLRLVRELKRCQSQGATVEETLVNIRKAAELFLETLTDEERLTSPHRVVLTIAIEVRV